MQQVFWQVRVWDQNDSASAWSSVATWTMGLLNQGDWQGGWLVFASQQFRFQPDGMFWIWYPEGNPARPPRWPRGISAKLCGALGLGTYQCHAASDGGQQLHRLY